MNDVRTGRQPNGQCNNINGGEKYLVVNHAVIFDAWIACSIDCNVHADG